MLLALGVPERAAMGVMGWSSTSMAARYQHMTDPIWRDIAKRLGGLLWAVPNEDDQASGKDGPDDAGGAFRSRRRRTETKTETKRLRGGSQMWEPPRFVFILRESATTL